MCDFFFSLLAPLLPKQDVMAVLVLSPTPLISSGVREGKRKTVSSHAQR